MICAKFGWNWPNDSGEDENAKSLRTDDRQQAIIKFSSGELKEFLKYGWILNKTHWKFKG